MKSENWLIVELGAVLFVITILSFFVNPVYPKGADHIIGALTSAFTMVIGYKFGRSMPEQTGDAKGGQQLQKDTTVVEKTHVEPSVK